MNLRQKLFLLVVVIANVLFWAIPSNVVELVARDRHTLLGRYSRGHLTANFAVALMTIVGFYIDWAKPEKYKLRWFQVSAVLLFLIPVLAVVDFALRTPEASHYIRDTRAYHRPPNETFHLTFQDHPKALRSYPGAGPGYGTVKCVYHSDEQGYRNASHLERYDIVVLGDSFAEGSKVSDEMCWPARLQDLSDKTVCNLGMSGYAPVNYLAALEAHGLAVNPQRVLCLIYEGNDFRTRRRDREKNGGLDRTRKYIKQSPIISRLDRLMINTFAPIGANRSVAGLERLAWLPVSIPDSEKAPCYAFPAEHLMQLLMSEQEFRQTDRWRSPAEWLARIHDRCRESGVKLTIVYAPTKPHVILPLIQKRLPLEDVRFYCSIRSDDIPELAEFAERLNGNIGARENVVRQWSESRGVTFCSLTESLRAAVAAGRQAYYTYDEHWSPTGHQVVAEAIDRFLAELQISPLSEPVTTTRSASDSDRAR